MTSWRRKLLSPALSLFGLEANALDESSWLLQSTRTRGERAVWQIGPRQLRTHLVVDEEVAREQKFRHQITMESYLGDLHLSWVLEELGIDCVLDVGANTGQFARRLRRHGYTGRIVSFEPLPHLVEELREAAAEDPDWHVFGCALGDEETTAEINVVPGKMSSMLDASEFGRQWKPRLGAARVETVDVRRLDSVYDECIAGLANPRVFLKMDTQGYDLATMHGAGRRLDEIVGLQSELACVPIYEGMRRLPEQLAAYEAEGFEISGMSPVTRHRETLRVIEFDVVMVRPEALAAA